MNEPMEQVGEVVSRMDTFQNIAARAWPGGVIIGFCHKCRKEREYNWDQVAKMMQKGLPRCKCNGQRIDLRAK